MLSDCSIYFIKSTLEIGQHPSSLQPAEILFFDSTSEYTQLSEELHGNKPNAHAEIESGVRIELCVRRENGCVSIVES